jgi:hypothetical protein
MEFLTRYAASVRGSSSSVDAESARRQIYDGRIVIAFALFSSVLIFASTARAQDSDLQNVCRASLQQQLIAKIEMTFQSYVRVRNVDLIVEARATSVLLAGDYQAGTKGVCVCATHPELNPQPVVMVSKDFAGPWRILYYQIRTLDGRPIPKGLIMKEALYSEENMVGQPPFPDRQVNVGSDGRFWDIMASGSYSDGQTKPTGFEQYTYQQLFLDGRLFAILKIHAKPSGGVLKITPMYVNPLPTQGLAKGVRLQGTYQGQAGQAQRYEFSLIMEQSPGLVVSLYCSTASHR